MLWVLEVRGGLVEEKNIISKWAPGLRDPMQQGGLKERVSRVYVHRAQR